MHPLSSFTLRQATPQDRLEDDGADQERVKEVAAPSGLVRVLGHGYGHARSGEETRQVEMVCVDDLVGADDVNRRIEPLVE